MTKSDQEILHLAIPSIVSNITVPLLGLVDLAIAGHLGSARYIAAISVGSMIFNVIYWLMGFLRMGTSGMTGQAYGAKDTTGIRMLLRRSLTMSLLIAAAFLVLQWPLREAALSIIHPSQAVWPLAAAYFNIVIWGAPAMLSLYSLNGWYIGMQDTRVPMVVAIFQNIANILASLLFVFALGMKVEGIALGTLVAQWSGVLLSVVLLRTKLNKMRMMVSDTTSATTTEDGFSRYSWATFFRTDRDIFLRTLCLVAVNLAFTAAGARQGDLMLAVNTLLMTFYTLFSYVMDGFAFAGEALGGKYFGARDDAGLSNVIRRLRLPVLLLIGPGSYLWQALRPSSTTASSSVSRQRAACWCQALLPPSFSSAFLVWRIMLRLPMSIRRLSIMLSGQPLSLIWLCAV